MLRQRCFDNQKSSHDLPWVKLLVLIFLIGVNLTMVFSVIKPRGHGLSPEIRCKANLKTLYTAMLDYAGDYGAYPSSKGKDFWNDLRRLPDEQRAPLAKQHSFFLCPCRKAKGQPNECHYGGPWYPVTDKVPGDTPLGWDEPGNHPKRYGSVFGCSSRRSPAKYNVLYFNGMIEMVTLAELQDIINQKGQPLKTQEGK